MSSPMVPYAAAELLERVVIGGDLSKLAPAERLQYYREVCHSLGLNPLTRPLEYLHLSGKLTLYARRDATDQLRKLHQISVERLEREIVEGVYVVTAYVKDDKGRTDSDLGAVPIEGLKDEARANAILKAVTKAKRRATLSICGLGMLDETELETLPADAVQSAATRPESEKARPPATAELQAKTAVLDAAREDLEAKLRAPAKRADPVNRAAETEPESGRTERPPAPLEEWLEAFTKPDTVKALEALWRGATEPDLWSTWSPTEQVQLVAAKNRAKQRLGIA
jgi:hypothetical protein